MGFLRLRTLQQSLRQWSGLVAKSPCPLCQRPTGQPFCLDCHRQLLGCQFAAPGWRTVSHLPVFAWGTYQEPLKRAIAALKYHHQPQLATPLGSWMADAWRRQDKGLKPAIVVPIPMYAAKQRERGFNQAELLARSFCAMTGLPLQAGGLVRLRATEAQFRMTGAQRLHNLKDAFSLGQAFVKRSPTQPILLLDDIFTTGATAQSAAQTLRSHGIRVQGIVVLAISELNLVDQTTNQKV